MDTPNQTNPNTNFPSNELQQFLSAPYIKKIEEAKSYFSSLNNNQLQILNTQSEERSKNTYQSLLDSKNEQQLSPIKPVNIKPEFNTDFLFAEAYGKSLQNNYDSINDLKRKEDELSTMTLQNESAGQIIQSGSGGGGNSMNSNVTNNNMYITNITPDYMMSIKRKSQSPPAWRDSSG